MMWCALSVLPMRGDEKIWGLQPDGIDWLSRQSDDVYTVCRWSSRRLSDRWRFLSDAFGFRRVSLDTIGMGREGRSRFDHSKGRRRFSCALPAGSHTLAAHTDYLTDRNLAVVLG